MKPMLKDLKPHTEFQSNLPNKKPTELPTNSLLSKNPISQTGRHLPRRPLLPLKVSHKLNKNQRNQTGKPLLRKLLPPLKVYHKLNKKSKNQIGKHSPKKLLLPLRVYHKLNKKLMQRNQIGKPLLRKQPRPPKIQDTLIENDDIIIIVSLIKILLIKC